MPKENQKWFARRWRGGRARLREVKFSFACQKRTRKAPATFEAREARIKGCSPLIIPKGLSKPKNASRFAKRIFGLLGFTAPPMVLRFRRTLRSAKGVKSAEATNWRNEKKALSAATSFSVPFWILLLGEQPLTRWRVESRGREGDSKHPPYLWAARKSHLTERENCPAPPAREPKNASRFAKRIFFFFSHLRLRRRFHVSAELYALRGRNTSCEAANRRNEKKALSAATSFFPFRQPLWDYQGRAALDSCLPRLESSGHFSGSLLVRKRELSPA